GEIIKQGDMKTLTQQQNAFQVALANGQTFPREELAGMGFDVSRAGELWEIGLKDGQSIDAVVDFLRGRKLSIRHLVEKRVTLEDIFMETVVAAEPGVDRPARRRRPAPRDRDR